MAALPPAVGSLVGIGADSDPNVPAWATRLREAAYTTPSGTRIKFKYVVIRRTGTKRGTVWEFSGVNDAYIQPKGFGPRRYPLRCIFSGADHDLVAKAFEAGLYESGHGTLEHPRFADIDVVPFGDIDLREDLVFARNQSIVEVTFWTSLKEIYPSAAGNPKSEIESALGDFDVEAAQEFDGGTDLATAAARASTKSTIQALLREVSSALTAVSEATSSARQEFSGGLDVVNEGIDTLIGQPVLLAQQLANLTRSPGRALAGIQSRLDGYGRLLDSLIGSQAGSVSSAVEVTQAGLVRKQRNDLQVAQLLAMNAIGGMVVSVLEHDFATRPEVLEAAATITEHFEAMVDWRDQAFRATGMNDDGQAYQALQHAVALTAGFLVEVSFTTVREQRITLDRARTIVDLCAELYGSVDDKLDLLIASNDLTGDEILELPRGRTIAYYPQ